MRGHTDTGCDRVQVRLARRITAEERRAARARDAGPQTDDTGGQTGGDGAARFDHRFVQVFAKETPSAGTNAEAVSSMADSPAEGEPPC